MNNTINKKDQIKRFIDKNKITLETEFVPFSQSRNKHENSKSLNWKITLKKCDTVIITSDYVQGIGHCPSYKNRQNFTPSNDEIERMNYECETGIEATSDISLKYPITNIPSPDIVDVLYCLVIDSEALDYAFEDWINLFGYDSDSFSARKIYDSCLDTGLKMMRGLGYDNLMKLRLLLKDY